MSGFNMPPGVSPGDIPGNEAPKRKPYQTFVIGEEWGVRIRGQVQRPKFNSRGAAIAFADAVCNGKRKPEPA